MMRDRGTSSSHEDVVLSLLYEQVTEMQRPGFSAGYDLTAGLDRYQAWLREHAEDAAGHDALQADGRVTLRADRDATGAGMYLADVNLLRSNMSGAFSDGAIPEAFPVTTSARVEWSADRAVTELYSERYRELVRLAALLVRDTPTAEEVVQDAFVAMHGGWQRLRDTEKALAYLRQAVVNRSRSVLRHRMVVEKNLQKAQPDMPSAEHGAFALLERSAVVAALQGLPERQRQAIALRYYLDLSEAEIAAAMDISRGAVKSHTARGMAALRAALEQQS
jgi:RNA polymerase sigma-70 factor (sigma-E family)